MGAPKHLLEDMRNDAHVLALIAATENAPVTDAVLGAVARWFDDVEVHYPIAEMAFDSKERRELIHTVSTELLDLFTQAAAEAEASGELGDERFEVLANAVDPLWRELTGVFAKELNARFEMNRVPAEHSDSYLRTMIDRLREEHGDSAANDFRTAINKDSTLRAHLRRIGIDPDAAI